MAMSHDGLTKILEECGELIQIAAKKIAFPDTDNHPDGAGSMKARLEDEIGDVIAAIGIVIIQHGLDGDRIMERGEKKRALFQSWIDDPNA